ncbi:MAG TPA: hypothetical protein VFA85_00385 [Terriglobales bacterium]|nr:hypothetical protein [Terriglobales bacterium]
MISNDAPPSARHILSALALASGFSLFWALIEHIGLRIRVSPYQVVWTRYATQLVLLLLSCGSHFRECVFRPRRLHLQILGSLLMLGMPLCFIAAVKRMPEADVMGIFWVAPLLVAAASALPGRERPGIQAWAATLAASAGAVMVTAPHASHFRFSALLPLGMAACFAEYQLILRTLATEPILPKLFHTALWVFLPLTLVAPYFWRKPSSADMILMTSIGLLGCLGLFLLDLALELAAPVLIAPAVCTQPLWVELLEHKRPDAWALAGNVLVLVAIGAVMYVRRPTVVMRRATSTVRDS